MGNGNLKGTGVFTAMLALVAVCCFHDASLTAGAGTAVAEETDEATTAQETAAEDVESAEQVSEASEGDGNGSEGQETASRPADGDEA